MSAVGSRCAAAITTAPMRHRRVPRPIGPSLASGTMVPDSVLPQRVDPRAYLRPIVARRWLVLLIVVASTAATYLYFDHQARTYEASTQIFVESSAVDQAVGDGGVTLVDSARVTANQAKLVSTRSVAENVAKKIGFRSDPGVLLKSLTVTTSPDTDFVTIMTTAGTPKDAAIRANAFATAFSEVRSSSNRRRLNDALTQARAELQSLAPGKQTAAARSDASSRVRQLEAITALPAGGAQVTDRAIPPATAISPHPKRSAVFAFFLSLVLSAALAFLIDLFDRRIKTIEDIDSTYPFPILAVIPHEDDATPTQDGALTFARSLREAFRSLRTSIGLTSLDRPTKTILVTSAVAGEGKSTVIRNLALAYAEAGVRVVVVETDLRRPTLAGIFGVERHPGLTDVLAGNAPLEEAMQTAVLGSNSRAAALVEAVPGAAAVDGGTGTGASSLRVLTSGPQPPNPPGVLASERTHRLLDDLAREADILLIDSPPLLAVSDAVPLVSRADAVVVVARVGHSTSAAGKRLVEVMSMIPDVRVAGVVVNDVQSSRLTESGLEYYYYGPEGE